MTNRRRSSREIRRSLHVTRKRLDRDLAELQERLEQSVSPRNILSRHPALVTMAGAVVGVLVVRNPALVVRALTRLAQASAPFVVRSLLSRGGSSEHGDAPANGDGKALSAS